MSTSTLILLVIGGVFAVGIIIYNRLVAMRQEIKNAKADIDVQTKQRYDLVPNLVETVKAYADHENSVFTKVTEARSKAMAGGSPAARDQAEGLLSGALANLMVVAEAYPDLKANENFQSLQLELSDLENKIAAARRFLNNAVTEYNTAIEQFPAVLIASALKFESEESFAINPEEHTTLDQAPNISFKD